VHAITFRPIGLEQDGTESVPVETMNEGKNAGLASRQALTLRSSSDKVEQNTPTNWAGTLE
jgi:hypothetical protein